MWICGKITVNPRLDAFMLVVSRKSVLQGFWTTMLQFLGRLYPGEAYKKNTKGVRVVGINWEDKS